MNRIFQLAAGLGAGLGVVALGFVVARAALPLPGIVGPSLGDATTNLYTLTQSVTAGNQLGAANPISVSQTSGQSNCTLLASNAFPIQTVGVSASTGYICLPAALPGREFYITNQVSVTIDIYGGPPTVAGATLVAGTNDYINNSIGSGAYTGLTSGKSLQCIAGAPTLSGGTTGTVSNGNWYCQAGS